jgi:hypothetical protein
MRKLLVGKPSGSYCSWLGSRVQDLQELLAARRNLPGPPQKNEFVSSATCSSCHEDLARTFAHNPQQILETSEKRLEGPKLRVLPRTRAGAR